MSPSWPEPDLVFCYLDDDEWTEGGSASGPTTWSHFQDDPPGVGQLVCWHEAEEATHAVRITFDGRTIERPVENGFVIWMMDGVAEARVDDDAEFAWLR